MTKNTRQCLLSFLFIKLTDIQKMFSNTNKLKLFNVIAITISAAITICSITEIKRNVLCFHFARCYHHFYCRINSKKKVNFILKVILSFNLQLLWFKQTYELSFHTMLWPFQCNLCELDRSTDQDAWELTVVRRSLTSTDLQMALHHKN